MALLRRSSKIREADKQGSGDRREREPERIWNLQNSAALTIESAVRLFFFTSEISPKREFNFLKHTKMK
jgi:hypothetical protein